MLKEMGRKIGTSFFWMESVRLSFGYRCSGKKTDILLAYTQSN